MYIALASSEAHEKINAHEPPCAQVERVEVLYKMSAMNSYRWQAVPVFQMLVCTFIWPSCQYRTGSQAHKTKFIQYDRRLCGAVPRSAHGQGGTQLIKQFTAPRYAGHLGGTFPVDRYTDITQKNQKVGLWLTARGRNSDSPLSRTYDMID